MFSHLSASKISSFVRIWNEINRCYLLCESQLYKFLFELYNPRHFLRMNDFDLMKIPKAL